MDINIKLEATSATNFAAFHGYTEESGISIEDFITGRILDRISNDLLEQANRQALASVIPVADVTSDLKQTTLKEQLIAVSEAKLEATQLSQETVIKEAN